MTHERGENLVVTFNESLLLTSEHDNAIFHFTSFLLFVHNERFERETNKATFSNRNVWDHSTVLCFEREKQESTIPNIDLVFSLVLFLSLSSSSDAVSALQTNFLALISRRPLRIVFLEKKYFC